MDELILEGYGGCVCQMDDILVWEDKTKDHDRRSSIVLKKLKGAGVHLNCKKWRLASTSMAFLGAIIDQHGMKPDPKKEAAVPKMQHPEPISDVAKVSGYI